jgi:hypothetical protein
MESQMSKTEIPSISTVAQDTRPCNTTRDEMLKEIARLTEIPEIKEFFARKCREARVTFQEAIKAFNQPKDRRKKELPEEKPEEAELEDEESTELSKAFARNKTFFFELTRIDDPESDNGFRWELGRLKLKAGEKALHMIFGEFMTRVEHFEISPQRILDEIVDVPLLNRKFKISYTKSSSNRVVGFVKEAEATEEKTEELVKAARIPEERLVINSNKNMLKFDCRTDEPVEPEDLETFLAENPEFWQNMIFTYRLKQEATLLYNKP